MKLWAPRDRMKSMCERGREQQHTLETRGPPWLASEPDQCPLSPVTGINLRVAHFCRIADSHPHLGSKAAGVPHNGFQW